MIDFTLFVLYVVGVSILFTGIFCIFDFLFKIATRSKK